MSTTIDGATLSRDLTRGWWLDLGVGAIAVLYGLFVLSFRPTALSSLAILIGIAFIFRGAAQLVIAQLVDSWKPLFYVTGALGIAAGIAAMVWPDATLRVIAIFIAWYLVLGGALEVIAAFLGPRPDGWWVRVVLGVVMFVLGAWAIGSPTGEVRLFVNLVGFYLLAYGLVEIYLAFALRSVARQLVS
jgi:uncharacterized membrane protein HdeD (DUF308 family)